MAVNSFRSKKFEDFEIVNNKQMTVGHIRVKPSGILWGPKGGRYWYGLSLQAFADFAKDEGTRQKK